MTSTISKFKQVKITWVDPCQCDESWTPESEILNHDVAECEDVGWIYKKNKNKQEKRMQKKYNRQGR